MKTQKNQKAFTLVELITVIVILLILGTIAFISLINYPKQARDSKRIADLRIMEKTLSLFELNTGTFPIPESAKPIPTFSGTIEGVFGENNFMQVGKIDKTPKDPLTNENYKYYITSDGKKFKIETTLEDGSIFSVGNLDTNALLLNTSTGIVIECNPVDESSFTFDSTSGTITAYNGTGSSNICIPEKINNVDVKHIGMWAFVNKELENVGLPSSLISIGDYAFGANKISNLVIPNSVTSIGHYAFNKNKISALNVPNSVTSIGAYAFTENQLTSVNLPNTITSIQVACFARNQLSSITIPNSVTAIGYSAFSDNQLTSVTIPNSVTSIGGLVFLNNKISELNIPSSVTTIGPGAFNNNQLSDDKAFIYERKSDGNENNSVIVSYGGAKRDNVIIPSSVTNISNSSMSYNKLTSVIIPNSVTEIGLSGFFNNSLTTITIPNSVTSLGENVFAFNQLVSIDIPSSIGEIPRFAFQNNKLTSVNLLSSLNNIGDYAFMGNSTLTSVNIPNSSTTCGGRLNSRNSCFASSVSITHNP